MRQACAEGNTAEALLIHEKFVSEYTKGQALLWISYKLLGLSEQATAVLMPYDNSNQLYALSGYLGYPYFDPRPFPNLMKWVKQEGIEHLAPIEIPYQCNLAAGSAK